MKRVFSRVACGVTIAAGAYTSTAHAEIQHYQFTWSVSSIYVVNQASYIFDYFDALTFPSGKISIGQIVKGIVSFDDQTPGITYDSISDYQFFNDAKVDFSLNSENFHFKSSINQIGSI